MWLEIETIAEGFDPKLQRIEIRSGKMQSAIDLQAVILALFDVYDPIAVHITKPMNQTGERKR
jgi:hypothetical protein